MLTFFGADFSVHVLPNPVLENQQAQLTIVLPDGEKLKSIALPPDVDGVRWLPNSRGSQTSIVNGNITRSEIFGFIVSKPGKISIPRIKLTTDKGTRYTQAVAFTVGKASSGIFDEKGEEIPLDKAVFLHIQPIDTTRRAFFVGEEIPIYVLVVSHPGVAVSLASVPELAPGSAFSVQQFGSVGTQEVTLNGIRMNAAIFSTKLQAMKAGKFDADFSATVNCSVGGNATIMRSPFDDPFFNDPGFFGRRGPAPVVVPLKGSLMNLEIKNRPPVPAGVMDLGVITARPLTWNFSTTTPKQGDPVYLDLQISGNPSGFKAPEINLDGFRSYPPEMTETPASGSAAALTNVRLMFIPLNAGTQKIALKFATLDPASGDYKITAIDQELKVAENKNLVQGTSDAAAPVIRPQGELENSSSGEEILASNILYVRNLDAVELAEVSAPWSLKGMLFAFLSAVVGWIVFCAVLCFYTVYSKKQSMSPESQRRARARCRKGEILKKLGSATEENFDALVRTDVADYIADAQGLASFDEARSTMKNKDLAEVVQAAEIAGYNPNARCGNVEKFRKIVEKAIRNSVFLLLGGIAFLAFPQKLCAAEAAEKVSVNFPVTISDAKEAYATGKFDDARKAYETLAEARPFSPDVWFNLGNAHYQLKNFSSALLCYERAYRLELRDSRGSATAASSILSNLNATRIQLGLLPRNEVKNPADFLIVVRDGLPQFYWLAFGFLAFAGLSLIAILVGVRKNRRGYLVGASVCGALALGVALFNAVWLERGLFNTQDAIVLVKNASVWNLPIEKSAKKIATVPAGQCVRIIETREHWLLVRTSGGAEGWVVKTDLAQIWGDFTVPALRK